MRKARRRICRGVKSQIAIQILFRPENDNTTMSPSPHSPSQKISNPFSKNVGTFSVPLCTCGQTVQDDGTEYAAASKLAIESVLRCSGKLRSGTESSMIGRLELPYRGEPFEPLSFTLTAFPLLDAIECLYSSLLTLSDPIDVIDLLQQRHDFKSLLMRNDFRVYNSQIPTAIYSPSTHRQHTSQSFGYCQSTTNLFIHYTIIF